MHSHDDRMVRIGRLMQQLEEMQRQMDTVVKVVQDLQRETRLSAQLTRAALSEPPPVGKQTGSASGKKTGRKRR